MKTVGVNAVFIREEAKQARDTHRYILSMQNSSETEIWIGPDDFFNEVLT